MKKYLPILALVFVLSPPVWATKIFDAPCRSNTTDAVGEVAGAVSRASTGWYFDENNTLQSAVTNMVRVGRDGILHEGSSANEMYQSRDFDTTWTIVGSPIKAQNEIGIDGVANTAWTVTDDAGYEALRQPVTIADDDAYHCFSLFVKKTSGAVSAYPAIWLNGQGGSGASFTVYLQTTTGATIPGNGEVPAYYGAIDYGDWWHLWLTYKNDSSGITTVRVELYPSGDDTGDGVWSSVTGSAIFDQAQWEMNQTFPTSPILTTDTAPVSRATEVADAADVGYSWVKPAGLDAILSGGAGSVVFKWTPGYGETQGTGTVSILSWDDSTSSGIYTTHTDDLKITDGTNTASVALTWVANHSYVVGAYWDDAGATKLNIGYFDAGAWTWGAEQPYDGAFAITDDKLKLGYGNAYPFSIQGIRFYDALLTAGPLVNITANNTTIQNTLINCEDYLECVKIANGVTGTVLQNVTIVNSNGPGINGLADILAENVEFFENETDIQITTGDTVTGNNNALQDWKAHGAGTYTDTSTIFSNYDAVADREAGNFRLIRGNAAINAGKDLSGTFTTDLDGHLWLYDGTFGIGCYRWAWTGNYGGVTNPYKINGQFAHEVYKVNGNTSTSAP